MGKIYKSNIYTGFWALNRSVLTMEKYNPGWKKNTNVGDRVIDVCDVLRKGWEVRVTRLELLKVKQL